MQALEIISSSYPLTGNVEIIEAYAKVLLGLSRVYHDTGDWVKGSAALDRAMSIIVSVPARTDLDAAAASLQGSYLESQGRYKQAERCHGRALLSLRQAYGESHPHVAATLCQIGHLRVLQCRLGDAAPLLEESLAMRKKFFAHGHPAVAMSMYHIAVLHCIRGNAFEAIQAATKSLEIRVAVYGDSHPIVADSRWALGEALRCAGDTAEAEKHFDSTLRVRMSVYESESHQKITQVLQSLAQNAEDSGLYLRAVELYDRALTLRIANLRGQDEPLTSRSTGQESVDSAASQHSGSRGQKNAFDELPSSSFEASREGEGGGERGDADRAGRGRREGSSSPRRDKTAEEPPPPSPTHPDIELNKILLANVLTILNRFDQAKVLMHNAGKILCTQLGNEHTSIAMGLYVSAVMFTYRGEYKNAKRLLVPSLEMVQRILGPAHPMVATVLHALAEASRLPGYFRKATEFSTAAYSLRQQAFPADSIPVSLSLHQLGQIHRDMASFDAAEEKFLAALQIIGNFRCGRQSVAYVRVLSDLGDCQRLCGKVVEATSTLAAAKNLSSLPDVFASPNNLTTLTITVSQCSLAIDTCELTDCRGALAVLSECLPLVEKLCGRRHPLAMYIKGSRGLCINIIHDIEQEGMATPSPSLSGSPLQPRPNCSLPQRYAGANAGDEQEEEGMAPSTDDRMESGHLQQLSGRIDSRRPSKSSAAPTLPPGQALIDTALEYFDTYSQGPFGDDHPWVVRLGGWSSPVRSSFVSAASSQDSRTGFPMAQSQQLAGIQQTATATASASSPPSMSMLQPVKSISEVTGLDGPNKATTDVSGRSSHVDGGVGARGGQRADSVPMNFHSISHRSGDVGGQGVAPRGGTTTAGYIEQEYRNERRNKS